MKVYILNDPHTIKNDKQKRERKYCPVYMEETNRQ